MTGDLTPVTGLRSTAMPAILVNYTPPRSKWLRRAVLGSLGLAAFIEGVLFALSPQIYAPVILLLDVALAGLVIWILPITEKPPVRLLEATFFLYLASIIVWPYYLAVQLPGFPLIEVRRILLFFTIIGFAISLSVSKKFQHAIQKIVATSPFIFKLLAAFVVIQMLSLVMALDHGRAFASFFRNNLSTTLIVFVAAVAVMRGDNIQRIIIVLKGLTLLLCVVAIAEFRNKGILWANHIPKFLTVSDPAMENLLSGVFRSGEYRVTATFSVSLALAEFFAMMMPLFIHGAVFGKSLALRVIHIGGDALIFCAILLTQARTGIVGALTAHTAYMLIYAYATWRKNRSSLVAPIAIFAASVGSASVALAVLFVPAVRIRALGGGAHGASSDGRIDQLRAAMRTLPPRALNGYGPSQGGNALGYTNPAGEQSVDIGYLAIALDYGLIGVVLFVLLFGTTVASGLKVGLDRPREVYGFGLPLAVVLLVWLVSRIGLAQPDNSSLTYVVLGAIVGLAYKVGLDQPSELRP